MKALMTACGFAALLAAAPALAQTPAAPVTGTVTGNAPAVASTEGQLDPTLARMNAEQLKDKDVYGSDGKEIAEVEGIVSRGGQTFVVLDVDGVGGIADKDVVLPLNRLHMQGDRLTVGMTKDQLQGLETWQKGQYEDVKGALK